MKKAFLFVLGFLIIGLLTAQPYDNHLISNGEVSPDFSKGDYLSSDVVHLYDYLDSGKTVFIFFFLYDEASGWAYHQSGVLQQLYDTYGPSGNNSIEIIACSDNPYWDNLTGLGDGSQGNWTTDMPYHLINDGGIDGFKLFGTVSVYRICPDRSMFEMGFPTQWALQQSISQCALSSQAFDAKIMYSHLDTVAACPLEMRSGMAFLSNMGTNVLTDVDIKVEANEQEVQSFHWQGNLPKYHVDTIFLDNIPLSLNGTDVKIYTDNPNGIADQNPENDTLNWPLQGTYQWDEDKIYVEVHTDGYGHQIYWDIKGSSGDTLGMGGNGTVGLFDGAVAGSGPGYYYDDWYYQDTIDLTNYSLDCITIRVLSGYGYGTCCTWGNGYIRFKKGNNVIFNYTDFGRRAYAKILPTFNLEALHVGYQLQHTTVGEASGQIGIYAEKGMPPYQYSIDCGQSYQNESTLDSLSAGTYCVSTMDVMGSIVTDTLTIYSIGNLSASYAVTHETNNQNNGSIGITATGGYPP